MGKTPEIKYPLLLRTKDDPSFVVFYDEEEMSSWVEIIDVENDEFLVWDQLGNFVELYIDNDKICAKRSCKGSNLIVFLEESDKSIAKEKQSSELEDMLFVFRLFKSAT